MNSPAHPLLHHALQKSMINLQKRLRISPNGLITPKAIGVFLVRGKAAGGFLFSLQNLGHQCVALFYDLPEGIPHATPKAGPRHKKVITLPIPLRKERLPKRMNPVLPRKLAVVVGCGVEGNMRIRQIMADFGGEFEDAGDVAGSHSFYQLPKGLFQVPRKDAMGIQRVQRVFFYGFLPGVGYGWGISVQVNVVAGSLPSKGRSAFIGFGSLPRKVLYMRSVKGKERFWQGKDSQAVDAAMRPEAPAVCRKD
jgi:hypothetical protein